MVSRSHWQGDYFLEKGSSTGEDSATNQGERQEGEGRGGGKGLSQGQSRGRLRRCFQKRELMLMHTEGRARGTHYLPV